MTNPGRKLEEEAVATARGRDAGTPARALASVTVVIGIVAGVLIVALLILWSALK
jgi:hypothetical protein